MAGISAGSTVRSPSSSRFFLRCEIAVRSKLPNDDTTMAHSLWTTCERQGAWKMSMWPHAFWIERRRIAAAPFTLPELEEVKSDSMKATLWSESTNVLVDAGSDAWPSGYRNSSNEPSTAPATFFPDFFLPPSSQSVSSGFAPRTSRIRLPSLCSRAATSVVTHHAFLRLLPSSHCRMSGELPIDSRAQRRWIAWFCSSCIVAALLDVIFDISFSSSPSTCRRAPADATAPSARREAGAHARASRAGPALRRATAAPEASPALLRWGCARASAAARPASAS
eukprot:7391520-Prymnesium_polylepis.2